MDIPESGRWERRTYAPYCHDCMIQAGYQRIETTIGLQSGDYKAVWYQKVPDASDEKWEKLVFGEPSHVNAGASKMEAV